MSNSDAIHTDKEKFEIYANTFTLKSNNTSKSKSILEPNVHYQIPIFQRPYSWTDEQVDKFISDIFDSYWGHGEERAIKEEPMFIGTMQLGEKDVQNTHQIIDGQQRLTTFLLLLKVLKTEYPNCEVLKELSYNWISTKVNNNLQQEYLTEALNHGLEKDTIDNGLNHYLTNALQIKRLVSTEIKDDDTLNSEFDIDRFVDFLLSSVYFVVIETHAGLSKTLQIFDAINTTGLDLNGGDVFKIRLYEYYVESEEADESIFNSISELYEKIDRYNEEIGTAVSNINDILGIYQYFLISRYNLPRELYPLATNTFFERLFDTRFKIQCWKHFKGNVDRVELKIEDINELIEIRYRWHKMDYPTIEDACATHLIWWSRYGRYWILQLIFVKRFGDSPSVWDKSFEFIRLLNRFYFIYSLRYMKAVNHIRTETYNILDVIMNDEIEAVFSKVKEGIGTLDKHLNEGGYSDFRVILNDELAYNTKVKNLVCRLSAMLDEEYKCTESVKTFETRLFGSPIDIEHIQAYHDLEEDKRDEIWKIWGSEINSLGNLVVLEQGINRSIGNDHFRDKKHGRGDKVGYDQSEFKSVLELIKNYPGDDDWNIENCKLRKKEKVDKILDYLFTY